MLIVTWSIKFKIGHPLDALKIHLGFYILCPTEIIKCPTKIKGRGQSVLQRLTETMPVSGNMSGN